eukprot:5313783-Pyramimonas_sp.AAC.1
MFVGRCTAWRGAGNAGVSGTWPPKGVEWSCWRNLDRNSAPPRAPTISIEFERASPPSQGNPGPSHPVLKGG